MSDDVIETMALTGDDEAHIPYASTSNPGIASFDSKDFTVTQNGKASIKKATNDTSGIASFNRDDFIVENGVVSNRFKTAYDLAVGAGFHGTLQEWLESLKVKGDTGDRGPKGDTGTSITAVTMISNTIEGDRTKNVMRITYSNGHTEEVNVYCKNGTDGVSVTAVRADTPDMSDHRKTVTPIYIDKSNGVTEGPFNIVAKNGTNGEDGAPGRDGVSFSYAPGIYYVPGDEPDDTTNMLPLPDFVITEENTAYIVDDGERPHQYDLYMHNVGASDWTIVNNWAGVPGPEGESSIIYYDLIVLEEQIGEGLEVSAEFFTDAKFNIKPRHGDVFMALVETHIGEDIQSYLAYFLHNGLDAQTGQPVYVVKDYLHLVAPNTFFYKHSITTGPLKLTDDAGYGYTYMEVITTRKAPIATPADLCNALRLSNAQYVALPLVLHDFDNEGSSQVIPTDVSAMLHCYNDHATLLKMYNYIEDGSVVSNNSEWTEFQVTNDTIINLGQAASTVIGPKGDDALIALNELHINGVINTTTSKQVSVAKSELSFNRPAKIGETFTIAVYNITGSVSHEYFAQMKLLNVTTATYILEIQALFEFPHNIPLYGAIGQATDGPMTQKATTDAINVVDAKADTNAASLANIINGITIVGKATEANKATNDGTGANIATSLANRVDIANTAGFHNSVYRGKDITSYFNDGTLYDRLHGRNGFRPFEDLYVGDRFNMGRAVRDGSSVVIIAGFNMHWNNYGDMQFNHMTLVPEAHFGTSGMNDSYTTAGAYKGSNMHTTIIGPVTSSGNASGTINEQLYAIFGSHLQTTTELLACDMDDARYNRFGQATGASSNWDWTDCQAVLMSEVEVYGSTVWSSSGYDTGTAKNQMPAFRFNVNDMIPNGVYYWLKDVASASDFCSANSDGYADSHSAGNADCVRPRFVIS